MADIFISYRRNGDQWPAGRICDRLEYEFGSDRVSFDTIAIQPGEDFVDAIGTKIDLCKVLLAVVGPAWLDDLARRLLDNNDFLRIEISEALKRGVRVIPVLLDGTRIPSDQNLPQELKLFSRRQGISMRGDTFRKDIDALVAFLKPLLGGGKSVSSGAGAASQMESKNSDALSDSAEVPDVIRRDIQLVHRAKYWKKVNGKDYWRLFIRLAEPNPTTLREIEKVVYHLHPTFSNPTREIFDKQNDFELKTSAWGEFEVQADIVFEGDYAPMQVSRYLNFR